MIALDRIDRSPFRTLFLLRVLNRAASPVCFSKGHGRRAANWDGAVDSPGFERTEGESSKIRVESVTFAPGRASGRFSLHRVGFLQIDKLTLVSG
jgi:hypothetical protein